MNKNLNKLKNELTIKMKTLKNINKNYDNDNKKPTSARITVKTMIKLII